MLVLTRRAGESVFLTDTRTGERVGEVKYIALLADEILRIGFECPRHIAVIRDNAKLSKEEDNGKRN